MSCMLWIALVASLLTQCLGDGNRVRRAPCSSPDKRCFSTLSVAANVTTNANTNAGGHLIDVFCAETKCPPSSFCFMGGCPCRPGYASSSSSTICDTRLPQKQANRWYTSSCPNLESTSGRTFDIDEKLESTGGENGPSSCPPHLRSCAYLCYSHDSYGVAVVPTSLWKVSQKAEGDLWRVNGGSRLDASNNDRASEHWRSFQNLDCLEKGTKLGNVIEVGAGPWTQLKGFLNIRPDLLIDSFTVWEPSAQRYMKEVASCSYATGNSLQKFDGSGHHSFPVEVISTGGESLISPDKSTQKQYDTLISINVIEHVQDAFQYLTGLYVSLKPGGLLIFHDRYYSNLQITDGDIYHPVRIKQKVLDHFLSAFDIIFNNCNADYDGRNDSGYYVIARKR